jgi:methionyl-tRNA formyltransferase
LHDRLAELGAQALLQALPGILEQRLPAQVQNDELATYASKLSKEEAKIDWREDAEVIARKIRAFNPFPVAHTGFNDQTLRLWLGHVASGNTDAKPGTLLGHDKHSFSVACGNGILALTQVQMPGKKAVSANEFYKAYVEKLSGPVIFG